MTAFTLTAGLPPEIGMLKGSAIVFEAVDPTTGLPVTGVTIANAGIYANVDGSISTQDVIPPLTPIGVGGQP